MENAVYGFDLTTSSDPQEVLCRTESGLEMRRIVRWMFSEPGSPWCAAQLAVVELKSGEQIGWDAMGQPIARRSKVRWQRTTPSGRAVMADGVDRWAGETGRPPVRKAEIDNAIRFLRRKGYVEREPRAGSPAAYRLTPSGYAATVLHRRACREEGPVADPPTPEQVGSSFEDLEVHFLDLSRPTRRALADAGVRTVRSLTATTQDDLPRLANVGDDAAAEIVRVLASLGVTRP